MKNIFTFGIFLFFLIGIGNNVSAAQFNSRLSGITNVPTARGYRVGLWSARATWYDLTGVTDSTNLLLPTYADDVSISAGDSIAVTAAASCLSATVNGTLCITANFNVNGNITVNPSGIFSFNSTVFCSNITNYGKFWTYNTNGTGSPKSLNVGYTYNSGTSAAGTGDYTILNDGIFGWYRTPSLTSTVKGSGFYVIYSNLSKSLTIQHSDGVTSGYVFTVASLYPDTKTGVNQNLNLNIKESIALIKTSSQPTFTLTNGDVFAGYNRTCTIYPNDTVFIAGGFHLKANTPVAQLSADCGNMTYNVYGCLDIATLHPSSTYNQLNLETTSLATNTSSLTLNIGDGTIANAGTLVVGKTINLVRTNSNQPLTFNPTAYSTVKFGYTSTSPVITCNTVAGTVDNTLFPSVFNNLAITNTALGIAVTLPNNPSVSGSLSLTNALSNTVTLNGTATQTIDGQNQTVTGLTINNPLGATLASPLTVSGALTLTAGNLTLGSSNLTIGAAGSISGGSSSRYVVTNGVGTLSQTAATTGTLFPVGTATSYAPATITPAAAVAIAASVSGTTTGTFTGYAVNADEWTLTPASATTATLALTPTTATNVTSPVIFSGIASGIYAGTTAATVSGSTFTASGITLAAAATQFATGGTTPATAVESNTTNNLLIYAAKNSLVVKNAKVGDLVTVYGISGLKVASSYVNGDNTTISLLPGIYIVKAGSTVQKVSVQ